MKHRYTNPERQAQIVAALTQEQQMAQSRDRVRFQLSAYYFDNGDIHRLLFKAFNIKDTAFYTTMNKARRFGHVTIVCRPSQFARFLIHREQLGMQNMFKELNATLFVPEPVEPTNEPLDVSSNPAPAN